MKLLWLDDKRNPDNNPLFIELYSDRIANGEITLVVWVKNFEEFVDYIKMLQQLPDEIAFDHDLHITHYNTLMGGTAIDYKKFIKNKTGFQVMKWFLKYCYENKLDLPVITIHTTNTVGKRNMERLLKEYQHGIYNFYGI